MKFLMWAAATAIIPAGWLRSWRPRDPERYYVARDLRRLLTEAGLKPQRRKTHVFHREFPVPEAERRFLEAYFESLREWTAPFLSPQDRRRCFSVLQPESPAYLLRQPHFSVTCLDHTLWGKKMP